MVSAGVAGEVDGAPTSGWYLSIMQRSFFLAMVAMLAMVAIGCHESASPQTPVQQLVASRPLVTDQLAYGASRADVRAWHGQHGWCLRRHWPSTDEFVVCDAIHPYLNLKTPPMYSMARYDAADRAIAYATFTPVPCRMYGRCDRILDRTVYDAEHDFVDHWSGLRDHLAAIGRDEPQQVRGLPSMQRRMVDLLAGGLDRRFGTPTWRDPYDYGQTWATPTSEIGLFVGGNGSWIIETHELRAEASASATP
jgi:hypothetical protein